MSRRPPLSLALALLLPVLPCFADDGFGPVDRAELAAAPSVEKDADAEVLEWKLRISNELWRAHETNSLRVKIFTARAVTLQGKVEIPYTEDEKVSDIAGRTILPDGTVIPLAKDAVFDRTLLKAGGRKVDVKSFAMPGVVPGAIIEYRWKRERRCRLIGGDRIDLQRDLPVRRLVLSLSSWVPAGVHDVSTRMEAFLIPLPELTKEKGGYQTAVFTGIPSYHEEPRMPPAALTRKALILFYAKEGDSAATFWADYAKELQEDFERLTKPRRVVRDAAGKAVAGAGTPEEKVERLFRLARSRVRNLSYAKKTGEKEKSRKENETAADTLERGEGTAADVNWLFASFCRAAGLDTRVAALADRRYGALAPEMNSARYVSAFDIAVKVGEGWKLFSPGEARTRFGMLPWSHEGQLAVLSDARTPIWIRVPVSGPDSTVVRRTADLRLSDDGALEGDVRIEETGHRAVEERTVDADSREEREKELKDAVKERLNGAEVTRAAFDESNDPETPFTISYHVRVPGFAVRAGKRLVVQPAYFQAGTHALFSASERTHSVYFPYAQTEEDDVTIKAPDGFTADAIEAAPPMTIRDLGAYETKLVFENGSVRLHRMLRLLGMVAPATSYGQVKKVFDALQERDERRLTLRTAS